MLIPVLQLPEGMTLSRWSYHRRTHDKAHFFVHHPDFPYISYSFCGLRGGEIDLEPCYSPTQLDLEHGICTRCLAGFVFACEALG